MKEHWKYIGCSVPKGYDPTVDGQQCYWFRREDIGVGGITLIIPRNRYWDTV